MSARLAINGGPSTVAPGQIKPWPWITDADRHAVAEVLAGENLPEQRRIQVERLAEEVAAYLRVKYCIPTNSGTAALHMCVGALGIEPGDEVIVPAFTFWASAAAVLHHNAIPVFVDVDPRTFCLDSGLIEDKITDRTKAIMAVHIHGVPADMDSLLEIAERHDLRVIEDVAQAHGATHRDRICGTLGDVAGFSTQASKVLTTGSEGGFFVTNDEAYYERASLMQYFGESIVPGTERQSQQYNALGIGWMYRGDTLGHAFVRSQLRRLDELNEARIANCEYLSSMLEGFPGVQVPYVPPEAKSVYYNYVLGFEPSDLDMNVSPRWFREAVQDALNAEGVPVGQWQRVPVPAQEVFQARLGYGRGCPWTCRDSGREPSGVTYRADDYPQAVDFLDRHFYIFDIHPPNDRALMELYVEAIAKILDNLAELPEPDPEYKEQQWAERNPWVLGS